MIVVVSRIRVTNGNADALAEQYRDRSRLVEREPGCRGVEILRSADDPDRFAVYTRWDSLADYDMYRRQPAFREAHAHIADIPGGVRIDPDSRVVEVYEVLS